MPTGQVGLDPETRAFYVRSLTTLDETGIPYLVGGAYALTPRTGLERHTKDLDIFILRRDRDRILAALAAAGYRTEVPFPHWLAKAHGGASHFIDLIHSSGNGISTVDDEWFEHAETVEVLGIPVRICPAEESIWSKAFVMERERFDGADVAHLIQALGDRLDWSRLLRRFGPHWRVLLAHLVLFGFIYPGERDKVPTSVLRELADRLQAEAETPASSERVCRGTLLSREQYLPDIETRGYADARLKPSGALSAAEVALWTAAIDAG